MTFWFGTIALRMGYPMFGLESEAGLCQSVSIHVRITGTVVSYSHVTL